MTEQQPKKQKKIKKQKDSTFVKKQHKPKIEQQVKVENKNKDHIKKTTPIHQLPTIQLMLAVPYEQRQSAAIQNFDKIKPFLLQFMQKKQGSRVLHLIFKWGNQNIKKQIHKCILTNWKDLIRSNAIYLIQKVSRQFDFPSCVDDTILLQNSIQGAKILNNYGQKCDENMKSLKNKIYEVWQKSKQNDIKSQQKLHNLALKVIQKGYDHLTLSKLCIRLAISTMFDQQKNKILQYYIKKQKEGDWIYFNDDQGVRLFIQIVNLCDAKQKKLIVRQFKGKVQEIIKSNSSAYVGLIKILTQVDDTKLIQNTFQNQLEGLFPLMNDFKHAFSVIFSLFSPRNHNFNILGKYEHTVRYTTCKKDQNKRKMEIRMILQSKLVQFLDGDNLYHILRHPINSKLIVGLYKSLQQDSQQELYNNFISRIAKLFLNDAKDSIKGGIFAQSLCAHQSANKIIKSILWLQDERIDGYCDEFSKLILKNLDIFIESKASFILLGLIEKGGRDYLLNQIKKTKIDFTKSPIGNILNNLFNKKRK